MKNYPVLHPYSRASRDLPRKKAAFLALAAASAIWVPASAQTAAAAMPPSASDAGDATDIKPKKAPPPSTAGGMLTLNPVVVSDRRSDDYRAKTASVAGFASAPLLNTPASVAVVSRAQMDDQQAKLVSEVVRNDASVGNDYAPVGYYEDFSIRGFPVDLASAMRINGMTISGEQNVALENKESVEILKGLAGLESGVVAPGGIINFVTKPAVDAGSVTLGADLRGGSSQAVDLGQRFGNEQQFGIRINAAHEDIHSYVDDANGYRDFGSIATQWKISPRASVQFNLEYQDKQENSVSGYQLLGGTVVPPAASVYKMLGEQPWAKPVTDDSLNYDLRFDYQFNDNWRAYIAGSRSRTFIDDNVAFAYGCYNVASCGAGGTPPYYFGANGDYDVYDFRSPGETRRDDQVQAVLLGNFSTGTIRHDLSFGASFFRRTVGETDAVNDYVGSDNIYTPNLTFSPSPDNPGPYYMHLDNRQYSVFGVDRVSLSDQWQIVAGAREVLMRQQAVSEVNTPALDTDRTLLLPQLALIYKPLQPLTLYASYSKGLALGAQAPFWASNGSAFLNPIVTRQTEAGVKYDWQDRLSLTAAVFSMDKPYEYAKLDNTPAGYTFVQEGNERHNGIELGAGGRVLDALHLSASVTAIDARATDTGSPQDEGHQVINVPRLRASLYGDYEVPGWAGLDLLGGANYSGSKVASVDGTVSVPAYVTFNLGLRYATKLGGHRTTFRLAVDNLLNKYYWADSGQSQGDSYLFLGAPRTARLSLTYDF